MAARNTTPDDTQKSESDTENKSGDAGSTQNASDKKKVEAPAPEKLSVDVIEKGVPAADPTKDPRARAEDFLPHQSKTVLMALANQEAGMDRFTSPFAPSNGPQPDNFVAGVVLTDDEMKENEAILKGSPVSEKDAQKAAHDEERALESRVKASGLRSIEKSAETPTPADAGSPPQTT